MPELLASAPSNNREFLYALAGELNDDERLWTCTFSADPLTSSVDWTGQAYTYADVDSGEAEMANAYYSVAVFRPDQQGTFRRKAAQMTKMFVVVLDDVGTKAEVPSLPPTYLLETSPNNFQAGYRLASPITDADTAKRLLRSLVKHDRILDKSGNSAVRYARLPFGTNTKACYGIPFRHRLVEWRPDRSFDLAEICDAFGLDSNFIATGMPSSTNMTPSLVRQELYLNAPEHVRFSEPDELTLSLAGKKFATQEIPPTAENQDIVAAMLRSFPPDSGPESSGNRMKWLCTIWAVASLGWDDIGEKLCREWSQTGGLYDVKAFESAYHSYDKRPDGITFATLVKYALDAGYRGRLPSTKATHPPTLPAQASPRIEESDHERSDILNGRLFAKDHRSKFKYVFSRAQWMQWNGNRWVWCDAGEEMAAAKATAIQYTQRVANAVAENSKDSSLGQALKHAWRSQDVKRLDAMLRLAASEADMGIGQMGMLDADPMLLGVTNGVVHLSHGTLLDANPSMLITRQCRAAFDRDAKCPSWIAFLDSCFPNDPDMIRYLQKAMGYTLTGNVSEEVMHFCYGTGRNGKSVMANVLFRILGDYAVVMRTESLMRGRNSDNGQTNDIARLAGARLVLANETRVDQCLDDARLKELVSTETITARFLHREFFHFKPAFKIWVRGNHKPRIADTSNGAWRRIRLVPFSVQVPETQADPTLEEKLMKERDGILAWMVEGCLLWQQEGLAPCRTVKVASEEYRTESDILGLWLTDECKLHPALEQDQEMVWQCWQRWCDQNGHRPNSKNYFTRRLKERGIEEGKRRGKRTYRGIECASWLT